jgi:hypothetical protein
VLSLHSHCSHATKHIPDIKQNVLLLIFQEVEREYQRKLQAAIERPQSEKLHPSRRRTMERHGGSAR